jgi:hypothetical protein
MARTIDVLVAHGSSMIIDGHSIQKKETYRVGLKTPRRCDSTSRILHLHSVRREKDFARETCTFTSYINVRGTGQDEGATKEPFRVVKLRRSSLLMR